jgi:hypothetical protein
MFEGGVPKGLAEMAPGPQLAAIVSSIDRRSLSGHDQVLLLRAERRLASHYQARAYASMVAVAESTAAELESFDWESADGDAADEIRAALTLTRRSAEVQLGFARQLVDDYPRLWAALSSGSIDVPRAMVVVSQTCHLEPETRDAVVEVALVSAGGQTTGQLRARLQRLIIHVDPTSAKGRYDQGLTERRTVCEPNDDGTANLCGYQLHAPEAQAVMRRINRLARAAHHRGDPRTMDQVRADVFLDLLAGRDHKYASHDRDRAVIDLRADLTTVIGLDGKPGEIPGWARLSPTLPDRSSLTSSKPSGGRPSPSPKPGWPSGPGPPVAVQPRSSGEKWRLATKSARFRDAVCLPPNATSTTTRPGLLAGPPSPGTTARDADTTTG